MTLSLNYKMSISNNKSLSMLIIAKFKSRFCVIEFLEKVMILFKVLKDLSQDAVDIGNVRTSFSNLKDST